MQTTGVKSVAGDVLNTAAGTKPAEGPPAALLISKLLDGSIFKRVGEVQVGEYTGTGAAQDVALEFDPLFVLAVNLTDADAVVFAFNTASVGTKSYKASGAAGAFVIALIAAQGILFGAAGSRKFSLGTDAIANENLKVYQFIAIGA